MSVPRSTPGNSAAPVSTRPFERGEEPAVEAVEIVLVGQGRAVRQRLRPGQRLVVGRDPQCDLPVADDNVSWRHLALHGREGGVEVEDLGSSNGTFLRGVRLREGERSGLGLHEPLELASSVLVLQPVSVRAERATFERLGPILAQPQDFTLVRRLAGSEGPCAVVGPPGSGKSEVARALHVLSRGAGPIEVVDVAAVDPSEVPALLFGRDGSGRAGSSAGRLELANGGTLVLLHMEALGADVQRRLLECIDRKSLRREGATSVRRVDVALVFVSRDPISTLVRVGGLDAALAHRLRGRTLELRSLAERSAQLGSIVGSLLPALLLERGRPVVEPEPALVEAIAARAWPGNLRELVEVLNATVDAAGVDRPGPEHLPHDAPDLADAGADEGEEGAERRRILEALHRCNGNQTAAAKLLGIARRTLINRIERYGIPRPRKL